MLENLQSLSLLTLMEIVGPILLGIGLIYGIYHSRRRPGQQQQADAATKRLYTQGESKSE
jgi:hypothetical protein